MVKVNFKGIAINTKRNNRRKYNRKPKFEELYPRNSWILAKKVRVVGEGVTAGIYALSEALQMASTMELDLVQVSDKGDLPVCKIIDFEEFRFQQKKAERAKIREQKTKTLQNQVKLSPNMGQHDLEVRKKKAIGFLEKRITVKIVMEFRRGRSFFRYKDEGRACLKSFIDDLLAFGGHIKHDIKEENRRMVAIIDPGSIKKKKN